MTFQWPEMLWFLAGVPALVGLYVWLMRRRKKNALRYASLSIVREAMGPRHALRRHLPPALLLLSLVAMIVAMARPSAVVTLPFQRSTIILAMDVSGSMRAQDVQPNRLVAAQNAARAFIADTPPSTQIGIVSFAGTASVVSPPTNNREDLYAAIERFQMQRATAIGSGIIVSLATIFPDAGIEISHLTGGSTPTPGRPGSTPSVKMPEKPAAKVPPGSYNAAAIILLTDGQRTTGPDTMEAARMAADRGVRIFTVGIGTTSGEIIGFEGWSMRVKLDEATLKSVANATQAEYFYAGTAESLKKIYEKLSSRLTMEKKETEISGLVALVAATLAMLSAGLSLLWFNRIL